MTRYLLILPWGTVCSVKQCGRGGTYFKSQVVNKSLPVKLNYVRMLKKETKTKQILT